jgi:prophage regulatory protein
MAERILKRPEVEYRTGLSRSTLYQMIAEGRFPKPIKLGLRAVGWSEGEIATWIESRKALRGTIGGGAA